MQSHIKAIEYARENKLPCIAIFEDDIVFTDTFEKDFKYYLSVMPEDWHILYLGGSFGRRPSYFDQNFTKQNMTWGAFAYIVNACAYDNLLDMFNRAKHITDAVLIDYQKTYLCIKPSKKLVIHPKGFSTIKEREVDYKNIV